VRAAPLIAAAVTLAAACAFADPAAAQVMGEPADPYPDVTKFASGFYGEAEAGALVFVGSGRRPVGPGMALGARLGFDIQRWVAVQIHGAGSTHITRLQGRPQDGQLLQIYQGTVEVKLTLPLGQWSLAAFGGVGAARLSTNILGTAELTRPNLYSTAMILGGGGVDYHTRSRHFAFGLSVAYMKMEDLRTTGALSSGAHVRYTF
jgi:hypothetical protein